MIIKDPSQHADHCDEFFERTSYFYEAVTCSKAMITKIPDVGQAYLGSYSDSSGNWLDGGRYYTLNVPANPPALGLFFEFWLLF